MWGERQHLTPQKFALLFLDAFLSLLLGFFLVGESSLSHFVLGARFVSVVEAIAKARGDLFPGDRLGGFRVPRSVVSDKGRCVAFLSAEFFDRKVNVGHDRRFDHLGLGVDVILDLVLDQGSQLSVSRGFLGYSSLSDDDSASGRLDRARRRSGEREGCRLLEDRNGKDLVADEVFLLEERIRVAVHHHVRTACDWRKDGVA
mmetsp:Transcript_24709/g.68211  ORF Transcript_24709/g.68211 Transcript_24709/m.68211 type:complete len:202 (-) Transcript_24709:157-762(-)